MRPADILPQRYERADVDQMAAFIADPAWALQQKLDGVRCLVRVVDGRATFHTHGGRRLIQAAYATHVALLEQSMHLDGDLVLDGELLPDGHLWLFDCVLAGSDTVEPTDSLHRRLEALDFIFRFQAASWPAWGKRIHVAPTARTAEAKAAMWAAIVANGHEGCVVKRVAAPYHTGSGRTRDVLKVKLTYTADVVVTGRNRPNRDGSASLNVQFAAWQDGQLVPAGSASMIGKPDCRLGDVIEVEYLNFQGAFVQPTVIRVRHDKTADEADTVESFVRPDRTVITETMEAV
jgi:ATP-dependent DNA ligase